METNRVCSCCGSILPVFLNEKISVCLDCNSKYSIKNRKYKPGFYRKKLSNIINGYYNDNVCEPEDIKIIDNFSPFMLTFKSLHGRIRIRVNLKNGTLLFSGHTMKDLVNGCSIDKNIIIDNDEICLVNKEVI